MTNDKTKAILYLLGIILYSFGIASIYYYPKNAHNTYMSENALMPGTAKVQFDYSDGSKISQFSNSFQNYLSRYNKHHYSIHGKQSIIDPFERSKSCSEWLVDQLKEIGVESYIHKYNLPSSSDTTDNTTTTTTTIQTQGYNVYSVLRAPKSDGRESIVLSASFNSDESSSLSGGATPTQMGGGTESSIGVALTIIQYLHKKGTIWLAKDIILIITDTSPSIINNCNNSNSNSNNIGLKSWLHDYHDSTMINGGIVNNYFPRAGAIQAAINIETSSKKYQNDHVYVLAEGSNGQLPNLDLINTVGRLSKREGYSKSVLLSTTTTTTTNSNSNNKAIDKILKYLPNELKTLAIFMLNQAIGIPTGDHGLFNKYHIDAITLGVSGSSSTMGSRVLIGTIRSLNNLLERLHQSFYYYLLPSPFLYVSIGEYMISLGLIISPLAISVIYLLISLSNIFTPPTIFTVSSNKKNDDDQSQTTQTPTPTPPPPSTPIKKNNLFEKFGNFKCFDTPKDIVYAFTIVAFFQLIGISLFSLPQTFLTTTFNILNYLSNFEIIGLFGTFLIFYLIIFLIISPITDKMFYSSNNNEPIKTFKEGSTTSTNHHLKSNSSSFFVFSNLPILIFITTMSLLNFSFCTFASILTIPLCFISNILNNSNDTSTTTTVISKIIRLIKKLIVYSLLLLFSPPVILYLFSHYILNDQNVFILLITIIKQYEQYSNLLFPFLTLIYIPLNLSILKSILSK